MRALASALTAMMVAMTEGGVRNAAGGGSVLGILKEETSLGVEHHGGQQQRKVKNRGLEKIPSVFMRYRG